MKSWLPLLAIGVGVLVTSQARAASDIDELISAHHHSFESDQNFAFELRIGQYVPDVDGDPNLHGKTPYATAFGTWPRLLPGAEFDWQALRIRHLGSLGPGVGISATQMSALAPEAANPSSLSAEKNSLQILPMYAVAVLRVDALWKDFGVPFVPYAKAGFGMAFWEASNSVNKPATTTYNNGHAVLGEGHTLGTQLAIGMAFNLNVLDSITAKNLDNSTGVNNTYIFGELMDMGLNGLGDSKALRLNDLTWTTGMAFEF